MTQLGLRLLMAAIGVVVFAVYAVAAWLSYVVLAVVLSGGTDLATTFLLVTALTLAVGYASYRFGTARLLADLDASALPRERAPGLYRRLDALADRMGVATPSLAVARMAAPNALAVSADDGVIVIDRALFRLLDGDELSAILAHELAHIERRDAMVSTVAYGLMRTATAALVLPLLPLVLALTGAARALGWASGRPHSWVANPFGRLRQAVEGAVLSVLAVLTLLLYAFSRRREYAADDRAVEVTGDPLALARALRVIERAARPRWGLLSPLVVYREDDDPLTRLFETHPPTDERVERLIRQAEQGSGATRIPVE